MRRSHQVYYNLEHPDHDAGTQERDVRLARGVDASFDADLVPPTGPLAQQRALAGRMLVAAARHAKGQRCRGRCGGEQRGRERELAIRVERGLGTRRRARRACTMCGMMSADGAEL
ncbi:MAG TPA: hypothetical protein VGM82_00125 [Gemmatimonadaceae bacterium]